jgi:hypothetical protein
MRRTYLEEFNTQTKYIKVKRYESSKFLIESLGSFLESKFNKKGKEIN